jgi:hypothetical protein
MEGAVYLLCSATALVCCLLLLRGNRRSGVRLLLWCSFFFAALALENLMLFVDLVIVPETDLSGVRNCVALIGVALLLYGLIWEVR